MICPVCEHAQELGLECEVCGRELGGLGALGPPPVAVEKLEGLEVTVADRVGDVPADRVAELEVTKFDAVTVAVERLAEVEPSGAAPVGEVPIDQVPDLSVDRAPDDGVRTAAPTGQATCRYCRNVQASGLICDRCGMRLPRVSDAALAEAPVKAQGQVRCKVCGSPGVSGGRCGECGRALPA